MKLNAIFMKFICTVAFMLKTCHTFVMDHYCVRKPFDMVSMMFEIDKYFNSTFFLREVYSPSYDYSLFFPKTPNKNVSCTQLSSKVIECSLISFLQEQITVMVQLCSIKTDKSILVCSDGVVYSSTDTCLCNDFDLQSGIQLKTVDNTNLQLSWKYFSDLFPDFFKVYYIDTESNTTHHVKGLQCQQHFCSINRLEVCKKYLICVETDYKRCNNSIKTSCKYIEIGFNTHVPPVGDVNCTFVSGTVTGKWQDTSGYNNTLYQYKVYQQGNLIISGNTSNNVLKRKLSTTHKDSLKLELSQCNPCNKCSIFEERSCAMVKDKKPSFPFSIYVTMTTLLTVISLSIVISIYLCWYKKRSNMSKISSNDLCVPREMNTNENDHIYEEISAFYDCLNHEKFIEVPKCSVPNLKI